MKKCCVCKNVMSFDMFNKNRTKKDGYQTFCRACGKKDLQERKHTEQYKNKKSTWHKRNKKSFKSSQSKYRSKPEVKALRNKNNAEYRANKLNATPQWLTEDQYEGMADMYYLAKKLESLCGTAYHVDHIVPLRGDGVCGLHVPWNLQVLESSLNLSKSNQDKPNLKLVYSNSKGLR